jgi:hypothetical protein
MAEPSESPRLSDAAFALLRLHRKGKVQPLKYGRNSSGRRSSI